ncbi:uncharacterized protein TRIADDRAFT_54408 [Trichoplax adhaerens]|uniref:WW domain-containing protein n=1 Tax=Trichoplax adhaerens TaxID=10228 RepID=B3RRY3_TRIAD|nr:predicted protein [Trichoplax adhaerens]EDV26428.1 predicted protein [Trichoplax adhaerens]|eukprot:XP_002110424.1 predicted protein [Trichoplax adhaerens]
MERGRSGRIDGYHDSRHQDSHRVTSSGHSPVNKRDRSPRYSSHHHRHHSRSYHTSQRHREADSTSQSSKYHQTQHTESSNRTSSTHAGHSSDIIASHSKKTVRSKGDWSEHMSSSGRKYYYNCKTEVSKWEKPKDWIEDDPNEPHHKQSTIHELVSPEEDDDGFNTEVSIQNKEVDIPLINHTIQPPPTTVNEESRHSRNANPEGGIYYNQAEHIANDMLSRSCSDAIKSKFEIFHARTYLNIARYKVECHDLRLQVLLRSHTQDDPTVIESSKV